MLRRMRNSIRFLTITNEQIIETQQKKVEIQEIKISKRRNSSASIPK